MKKIISYIVVILLFVSTIPLSGCSTNKNSPSCIGFVLNGVEVFFDENTDPTNPISVAKAYSTTDLEKYDYIANTGETFELSFIIKNPKNDSILKLNLDDSVDGKNKVYSSQSEKYNIKDITTEYIEDKDTYYTYVTLVITSCDIETERFITITEIDFARNNKDKKAKCDKDKIRDVKVFTKIATQSLTLSSTSNALKLNETATLSISKNPTNASMDDVVFTITQNSSAFEVVGNTVKCLNNSLSSQGIKIKATLDGVDSNEITIYPNCPISTLSELNWMRTNPNNFFYLTQNIDMQNHDWPPIAEFNGGLDGKGFKLSNFYVDETGAEAIASLIITNNGEIKNLTIENATLLARVRAGVFSAYNYGSITNCSVNGTIEITGSPHSGAGRAGFITSINYNTIEKCSASGSITGSLTMRGGICGTQESDPSKNLFPIIKNCFANTTIVDALDGIKGGGLVGENVGDIQNCLAVSSAGIIGKTNTLFGPTSITNSIVLGSAWVINSEPNTFYSYLSTAYGFETGDAKLNSIDFYTQTLGWDANIWDLTDLDYSAGKYPKLKH